MRSWHAFGTLARGYVDHAGMHGTYGTEFSKSRTLCGSLNVTKKTTINFYDMTTLRYLLIKEKFEQMCVIGPYFMRVAVSGGLF